MNIQKKPSNPRNLDADAFARFIVDRPTSERWQLIDGEPVLMMSPATGRHQRIAANLERLLNQALAMACPDLDAIRELGLKVEGRSDFRAIADVAVHPSDLGASLYFSDFRLAAEVLSDSNTKEMIESRRRFYMAAPACRYVVVVHQEPVGLDLWDRSDHWNMRSYRSWDDRIELPEFGFSCRLADLYRGAVFS
jgi:Uma2 family endonuclease